MPLSDTKKRELFDYYSENGFEQPTEKIAESLNICHKTFFNRYGNKSNSIEIAWQYWQGVCRKKWNTLIQHCNHSVEALTMTLYQIKDIRHEQPHYYQFTLKNRKYLEQDSFFFTAIRTILEEGKQCFHIYDDLNIETYTAFLLNNLFLIDAEEESRPDLTRYVLLPALTERGIDLFMETPFAWS